MPKIDPRQDVLYTLRNDVCNRIGNSLAEVTCAGHKSIVKDGKIILSVNNFKLAKEEKTYAKNSKKQNMAKARDIEKKDFGKKGNNVNLRKNNFQKHKDNISKMQIKGHNKDIVFSKGNYTKRIEENKVAPIALPKIPVFHDVVDIKSKIKNVSNKLNNLKIAEESNLKTEHAQSQFKAMKMYYPKLSKYFCLKK